MSIHVNSIKKNFGKDQFQLDSISFDAEPGEIITILGESGSGKTTLLRILAGFEIADHGSLQVGDQIIFDDRHFLRPEQRKIGMVFQDYALFPHLSVEKNILFGSKNSSKSITKWLELTGLVGFEKKYPHELSGGQQQRVAIARSLAAEPELILLDEPFSNLDDSIKSHLREEIRIILKNSNTTAIIVTHDINDCLAIADQILVLHQGRQLQFGKPEHLYHQPKDLYVSRLFGIVNELNSENANLLNLNPEKNNLVRADELLIVNESNFKVKVITCRFFGGKYQIKAEINNQELLFYSDKNYANGTEVGLKFKNHE